MTHLENLIQQITRPHVYIQTHNFPDPDSISCAFGLQKLLLTKNITSTICYLGEIDRYNTLKMIELLGIHLERIEEMGEQIQKEDEIILVDAQKGNSNIKNGVGTEIACIDHHPTYEIVNYKFSDIRMDMGACATIIAEYFFENQIQMSCKTATALSYGIRSDTDRLLRGTTRMDVEMIYRMYDIADQALINMLESRELYFTDLMSYSQAIDSIRVFSNISFASTGDECPEALIASISDFMLALVEVEFSVVYSVRKEGVKISVRSEGTHYDAGKITSKALKGLGQGGGHCAMAGGFIPLTKHKNFSDKQTLLGLLESRFLEELHKVG